MKKQDLVIRQIALKYNIKDRIIKSVATHPLAFARKRMADPVDDRPIRIKYFGVFCQKTMANKENVRRLNELLKLLQHHGEKYATYFEGEYGTAEELYLTVLKYFNERDKEKFNQIHERIVSAKGLLLK